MERQPLGARTAGRREQSTAGTRPDSTRPDSTRPDSTTSNPRTREPSGVHPRTRPDSAKIEPGRTEETGQIAGFTPSRQPMLGGATRQPGRAAVSTSRTRAPQGVTNAESRELVGTGQGKVDVNAQTDLRRDSTVSGIRSGASSRAGLKERRVSQVVLVRELKSDFWRQIIDEVNTQNVFTQEDISNFIARAISLNVVPDFKDREQTGMIVQGNEARMIVDKVSNALYEHIVGLTGKQFNMPQTGLEKIKKMEQFLLALEAKREKEQAEKAKQVETKITELQTAIQVKEKEKEVHRRSIMMEIGNLKKEMSQVASSNGQPSIQQAREIEQKMKQMESALQKANQEKEQDDVVTENLKKKIGCF